jgi:hypothetical protein
MEVMEQQAMAEAHQHKSQLEELHVRGRSRKGSYCEKRSLGLRLTKQVFADVAKEQENEMNAATTLKGRGIFGGPVVRAKNKWAKARQRAQKFRGAALVEGMEKLQAEAGGDGDRAEMRHQVIDQIATVTEVVKQRANAAQNWRAEGGEGADPRSSLEDDYQGTILMYAQAYETLLQATSKLEKASADKAAAAVAAEQASIEAQVRRNDSQRCYF